MQHVKQIRSPSANRLAGHATCTDEPCCSKKTSSTPALLVIVGILGIGAVAGTAEATRFNPPKLDGYSLSDEHDADGDGDGVKETHIQRYFNSNGDSIYSMTTNGHLWAWSLETKGESTGGPMNYVIIDSDCDGVFDEVYSLDDVYYLPDCVK
jgi:hypothetical protein